MGLCKDGYWRESERYEGRKYIGFGTDQKEALKRLAQKIADAKNGTTLLSKNTLVKKWAVEWLETYIKPRKMTDKSYRTYKDKTDLYIIPAIGEKKLCEVTETDLQKILNSERGKSFSHATKLRMVLKQMFHKAYRLHFMVYDIAEDLTLPAVTKGSRRSLTDAERAAILKTAKTHKAGPWVLLLLYCGLRPAETITLKWKDIDFKDRIVSVTTALESGTTDSIKEPKTASGIRVVPLPLALYDVLLPLKGKPNDYVFSQVLPQNKGKHHTESSLYCYWNNFKRQLDIDMGAEVYRNEIITSIVAEDLTPYTLRHTYCTDLEAAKVPLNVAKLLMGHSDIAVTANIYTHKSQDVIKAASRKINDQARKTEKRISKAG